MIMPMLLLAPKLGEQSKIINCKRWTSETTCHQSQLFLSNMHEDQLQVFKDKNSLFHVLISGVFGLIFFFFSDGKDWSWKTILFSGIEKLPIPSTWSSSLTPVTHAHTHRNSSQREENIVSFDSEDRLLEKEFS